MIEFKIGNIKICLHFSFFAIIALLLLIENMRYAIYGLYACIIHELGHLMMMQLVGVKTDKIVFYGAGIKIVLKRENILPFWKDILILISGCIINFMTFGIFWFLSFDKQGLLVFSVINLLIGLFNLLPIKCFDGGKIVDLFIERFLPLEMIPKAKLAVKIICILLLLSILILFFINKNTNFTLYITLLYFLFSAMLF